MNGENKNIMTDTGDGGQFSQGITALSKMLKIAFRLLTVIIILMLVYFFTLGGLFIVDSTKESVLRFPSGKRRNLHRYRKAPYPQVCGETYRRSRSASGQIVH